MWSEDEALMTAEPPKQDLRQEGPSAVSAFQIDRKKCLTWPFRRIVAFVWRKLLQELTNSERFFFFFLLPGYILAGIGENISYYCRLGIIQLVVTFATDSAPHRI